MANVILSLLPDTTTEGVECSMFLDDTSLFSKSKQQLEKAAVKVMSNMKQLGLTVQSSKCTFVKIGHGKIEEEQPLKVDDQVFEPSERTHLLGFDVHACAVSAPSKPHATRAECARERLSRCARLPFSRGHRARVIGAMVSSVWAWAAWEPVLSANYRKGPKGVRRQTIDALEGTTRPWEAAYEILAVAFYKGHQIDCTWTQALSSVVLFRKALTCEPSLREALRDSKPLDVELVLTCCPEGEQSVLEAP
eukprot:6446882-Amphidinium_carterae.2